MKKPKTKKATTRCVDLMTKTCPTCGKKFCRLNWADYVYKDGQKYYCCYTYLYENRATERAIQAVRSADLKTLKRNEKKTYEQN